MTPSAGPAVLDGWMQPFRCHFTAAVWRHVLVLVCGAAFLVAVVASPSLDEPWYATRDALPALPCGAALCAWGYRRFPRIGNALALVTLAGTVALLVAGRA